MIRKLYSDSDDATRRLYLQESTCGMDKFFIFLQKAEQLLYLYYTGESTLALTLRCRQRNLFDLLSQTGHSGEHRF